MSQYRRWLGAIAADRHLLIHDDELVNFVRNAADAILQRRWTKRSEKMMVGGVRTENLALFLICFSLIGSNVFFLGVDELEMLTSG